MPDRRTFLLASAAAALSSRALATDMMSDMASDPLQGMYVVNSLGNLHDPYGPPQPGNTEVVSPQALADVLASGETAVNITVSSDPDFEKVVAAIGKWDDYIRRHPEAFLKVFTTEDIKRAKAEKKVGIIYGFQNAVMMGDKAERVDICADLGVRIIQLTYNPLNQLGGGSMAPGDPGLTPFGRAVIDRLNARNVIVDLAHSGHNLCLDAARYSKRPICISHTGCKAVYDSPRNKTDEELKLVADKGGYVGIYFIMYLTHNREATSDDVAAHIEHALKVCGEDHVGFGSDYGVVKLRDAKAQHDFWADFINERKKNGSAAVGEEPNILPYSQDLTGPEMFRTLARKLEKRGIKTPVIEKIMGANFMRYSKDIWGA